VPTYPLALLEISDKIEGLFYEPKNDIIKIVKRYWSIDEKPKTL